MPELGGPTTWSGLYFQGRVVVYHLTRMLYDRATNSDDPIISVRVEAPSSVDDVLVTKESGARIFQSVKEAVKPSTKEDSAWSRMWLTIQTQAFSTDFDANRDLIEIVFPEKTTLGNSLEEIVSRASTSPQVSELNQRLSQSSRTLLYELAARLSVSDDELLLILKRTGVRFYGDPKMLHEHLMALLSALYPVEPEARERLFSELVHLVFEGASRRSEFAFGDVDQWLKSRGIVLTDLKFRSFSVIKEISGETTRFNAQQFFKGFLASWPSVRDGVPVPRTCYQRDRKPQILAEATKLNSSGKLRAYIIVGPRGVGKTTIAKQIAVDLSEQGHFVCWLDEYPARLHAGLIPEFRKLITHKQRVHVFAEIGVTGRRLRLLSMADRLLNDLAGFLKPFRHGTPMTIYLTVDSNHYELLKEDLEDILVDRPEFIRVPLNLDDLEIDSLIKKLSFWGALGRLENRPDKEIKQIFGRKANKVLLAALIEATNSENEKDEFNNILLREYEALPVQVQLAYPLVAFNHAYNILIPSSLFFSAIKNVPGGGDVTLEDFRASLSGVLSLHSERLKTRHPLIAKTLCDSLDANESYSAEETLWMPLLRTILKSVDEHDDTHISYLQEASAARVTGILKSKLGDLALDAVGMKPFVNLSEYGRGLVLNSVARTFQARGEIERAVYWADVSLNRVWPSHLNGAAITLMYCYVAIRNRKGAIDLADQIIHRGENPWHLLHAVRVLSRWGEEPKEAMRVLEAHEKELRDFPSFGQIRGEVLRRSIDHGDFDMDDNPWAHANWVHNRLEFGQIESDEAIERLLHILDCEPNIWRAFTDVCHLLLIDRRYEEVILLCDKLVVTCSVSSERLQDPNRTFQINPTATQSMALATKAWAFFRRDGVASSQETELLFQRSLELKRDNAWAYNWRGVFLHTVERESRLAEDEIRTALRYQRKIPPFYRNLARVILETNSSPYSREKNFEVIKLCEAGLNLCPPESYWNWGGLRTDLEAFLYCAKSLQEQHVPNNTSLTGNLSIGTDFEDID